MLYDVFISYRRESGTHPAEALKANLELKQYRVFMDTHKMGSGDFTKKLDKRIRESCNFVMVISKDCFPHNNCGTDYFLYEIGQAIRMGKNVIPVYYDDMCYDSVKGYLSWIEDFDKQNAITYHNDDPEGSIEKIIKYLKPLKEILKDRFETLSKEKIATRQDLMLLEGDKPDLICPVCNNSNSAALTYCNVCGYKFFDELEESVASSNEKIQERGRLEKHKELWRGCKHANQQNYIELLQKLEEMKNKLHNTEDECKELQGRLDEEKAKLKTRHKDLEVLMDKYQTQQSDIATKNSELSTKVKETEALHKQIESLHTEINEQKKVNDVLKKENKDLKAQCCDFENRQKLMEKQRSGEEVKKTDFRALKDLLTFKKVSHFSEGKVWCLDQEGWCLLTPNYKSDNHYENVCDFSEKRAAVMRDGKWGFIDHDENLVIPCIYTKVGDFSEGVAYYEKSIEPGSGFAIERGFLDYNGKQVLSLTENYSGYGLQFDDKFNYGLFKIYSRVHAEWINHEGMIVQKYQGCTRDGSNQDFSVDFGSIVDGIALGQLSRSYVVYYSPQNAEEEQMSSDFFGAFTEHQITYLRFDVERNIIEEYDGHKFDLEKKTPRIVEELRKQYSELSPFIASQWDGMTYERAGVMKDGLWGFVDEMGREVIPCGFQYVHGFSEGYAAVCEDDVWFFIDVLGNPLIIKK